MEHDQRAIHKLIILAILSQASGLTANQLMTLALETLYLDYFAFVQSYEELVRDRLVTVAVRKDEQQTDATGQPLMRCDITPQGRNILLTLENKIPLPIRSFLATALTGWRKDQLRENTVAATADPDANGCYQVRLRQHDGRKETVDLRLNVPNQAIAEAICANWRQCPQTLYLGLLSLLTEPVRQLPADSPPAIETAGGDRGGQEMQPEASSGPANPGGSPEFEDRQLNLPIK